MILGVHHTAISTADIELVGHFYIEHFGFTKIHDHSWQALPEIDAIVGLPNSAARMMLLRIANQCLELFQYDNPPPGVPEFDRPVSKPGFCHIAFAVRDIDAEYERLRAAGMHFHCPPTPGPALRVTYGRDPEGNIVELLEVCGDHPFNYEPTAPRWDVHGAAAPVQKAERMN